MALAVAERDIAALLDVHASITQLLSGSQYYYTIGPHK